MKMRLPNLLLLASAGLSAGFANAGFDDLLKSAGGLLEKAPDLYAVSGTSSFSDSQIDAGLKEALGLGAQRAVALLGREGGFLNDRSVRIPLPGALDSLAGGLRAVGQGGYVDAFETTVNRAAEEAIPETLGIVEKTIRNMSLQNVRGILAGSDDAATQYLRRNAGEQLRNAILPMVSSATDSSGATSAYKSLKKRADGMLGGLGDLGGLANTGSFDLDAYIADKTLDGFFLKLAAQEKQIRENPAARTTELLKTVFSN